MSKIHGESRLSFFEATGIIVGHGREDPSAPFSNGERLYGLYRGPRDCLFVDGARHVESMYVDPVGYAQKLDRMTEAYFT